MLLGGVTVTLGCSTVGPDASNLQDTQRQPTTTRSPWKSKRNRPLPTGGHMIHTWSPSRPPKPRQQVRTRACAHTAEERGDVTTWRPTFDLCPSGEATPGVVETQVVKPRTRTDEKLGVQEQSGWPCTHTIAQTHLHVHALRQAGPEVGGVSSCSVRTLCKRFDQKRPPDTLPAKQWLNHLILVLEFQVRGEFQSNNEHTYTLTQVHT